MTEIKEVVDGYMVGFLYLSVGMTLFYSVLAVVQWIKDSRQ